MSRAATTFEKLIRPLCGKYHLWQVFSDWCEASALTFQNWVPQEQAIEDRYLKIVGRYEHDEVQVFPRLLAEVIDRLSDEPTPDVLGTLFMSLELSSHWHGQFFTPMALCQTIAQALIDEELDRVIAHRGFVTVSEPACGAGAMVIAFATAMRERGFNPQTQLHVTAVDKDPTAAHMTMIQLSALGIPAQVVIGDTLRMQYREALSTPWHWLGNWPRKIARGFALGTPADESRDAVEPITLPAEPARVGQLSLFREAS